MIDFKWLNQYLLARISSLAPVWAPGGKKIGREYVAASPEGGPGDSFSVNMETGVWKDFANPVEKGGDMISWYARNRGIKSGEAAREIMKEFGLAEIVDRIPKPFIIKGIKPTQSWVYTNEDSLPVSMVSRYDKPDGKKFFSQQSLIDGKWEAKTHPSPRPLYNLPKIKSCESQVIIVEGEKAADFLQKISTVPVTTWIGGSNGCGHADWSVLKGRKAVIIPDADGVGFIAAELIAETIHKICTEVKIISTEGMPDGWDVADSDFKTFNDFLVWAKDRIKVFTPGSSIIKPVVNATAEIVQSELNNDNETDVSNPDEKFILWEQIGIPMTRQRTPINNLVTVKKIFDYDQKYKKNIWYDEFYKNVFVTGLPISDQYEVDIVYDLQSSYGLSKLERCTVSSAIQYYSGRDRRNEPLDWLNSLKWDGVPRVESLFSEIYGTIDDQYHRDVARYYICSIVARILRPGCQADNMVVFIGGQGDFKSTSVEALIGSKWYASASKQQEFGSDKMTSAIQGKLLMEIGELASFKRDDIEAIKNACTIRSDRYRIPYDRHDQDLPRSCLFVGTTNRTMFLSDPTGNRRFLPVTTGRIDIARLRSIREQLFAEARVICELSPDNSVWWKPVADVKDQQEQHRFVDPVEEALSSMTQYDVLSLLSGRKGFKTIDVAQKILRLNVDGALNKTTAGRISDALITLGFVYKPVNEIQPDGSYKSVKLWAKKNQF